MFFHYSNEEDTPDSLEIKPPQSIGRCEKPKKSYSSRSRSGKHSREYRHKERHAMRGSKHEARAERHHMSAPSNSRHGYTHKSNSREFRDPREQRDARNSRDGREVREQRDEREIRDARPQVEARPYQASANRYEKYRTDSKEQFTKINYSDREREKLRVKGYERKRVSPDKTDGERKLEDLRSKLLSKRSRHDIERNCEEHQNYQERELSRYEQNDSRRSEKDVHHQKYRSKKAQVEYIDSPENYADGDGDVDRISEKQRAPEDPELVARRAKLLDAEREMLKRKQLAREELKARREMQKEREDTDQVSPSEKDVRRHYRAVHRKKRHEPMEVVQISDNSDVEGKENDEESNYDEEESVSDSASNTNSEYSEEKSENELPASPLSVGELTKSDHRRHHDQTKSRSATKSKSRSRSPHRRESSRSPTRSRSPSRSPRLRNRSRVVTPTSDFEKEKPEENQNDDNKSEQSAKKDVSPESTLPSYFPGLQGCRSVEEFKCLNRIAEGTYGIVYRAQDKRTEEIVALKRLKMEKEKDGFPITSLREINTLLKGQHPNIVTVREIVVGSNMDKIFIVMDYVEHDFKTLMETMQHRKQSFLPGEVKCLTQQLLRAVAHLHDNWILHRDLKTSNLLLSHKGILKVGDFGLAREYGSPLKAYTSVVVTLWYRAPELLLCSKEYSTPIDMWSVGCIFAEFLAMQALFPGQSETDQLNKIFKVRTNLNN